ncbi:hypothetical protein PU32_18390, partial [Escherichia coli]
NLVCHYTRQIDQRQAASSSVQGKMQRFTCAAFCMADWAERMFKKGIAKRGFSGTCFAHDANHGFVMNTLAYMLQNQIGDMFRKNG